MAMQQVPPDPMRVWNWTLPDGTASNDWGAWRGRLAAVAQRRGFALQTLGECNGEPLLMLRGRSRSPGAPRLLVASGFHGEEPAGPWGVLAFLETAPEAVLAMADLSLLPLVNVSGFRAGTRFNAARENPNRGFLGLPGEAPSREGRLLLDHAPLLREAAADGLLTCHEDVLLSHGYLYSQERWRSPGRLPQALRAAIAAQFALHPDGFVDGCAVIDGIVFNHYDSSFESWLMTQGVACTACVETPGQQPIERRIAAQRAMIEVFAAAGWRGQR
jgi:predicted deacylase